MSTTIITAKDFLSHLRNNGDFRKFGNYEITENIYLPEEEFLSVNLGTGKFSGKFNFGDATFILGFQCYKATFLKSFEFEYTKFSGEFDCYEATFSEGFNCGNATFSGGFNCGNATFSGGFNCNRAIFHRMLVANKALFDDFSCGIATLPPSILATENYAIGMVIHHYKTSGVHFSLNDFKKD